MQGLVIDDETIGETGSDPGVGSLVHLAGRKEGVEQDVALLVCDVPLPSLGGGHSISVMVVDYHVDLDVEGLFQLSHSALNMDKKKNCTFNHL